MKKLQWQLWDTEHVAETIERYWQQDIYESSHRDILINLVTQYITSPKSNVLEIGCGTGLIYKRLVPAHLLNSSYVGVDVSRNMLEIARTNHPSGQFILGDGYSLNFEDQTFDLTLSFEVLGHIPEIRTFVQELCRVTKKTCIFTVWPSGTSDIVESHEEICGKNFLHRRYSDAYLREVFAACGFTTDWRVEVAVLSAECWAYLLHRSVRMEAVHSQNIFPFPGLVKRMSVLFEEERQGAARDNAAAEMKGRQLKEALEEELKQAQAMLKDLHVQMVGLEETVTAAQQALAARETELTQAQSSLEAVRQDLQLTTQVRAETVWQLQSILRARETEMNWLQATLVEARTQATTLEETNATQRQKLAEQGTELARLRGELVETQEREMIQERSAVALRTLLTERDAGISQLRALLTERDAEISQLQALLTERNAEILQMLTLGTTNQQELQQVRQQLTRFEHSRQVAAAELDSLRRRRVNRWLARLTPGGDLRGDIDPTFQQLKDDSLLFLPRLKGFRLQPSDNLQHVPFFTYPLELRRPNLSGVLLAVIVDFPLTRGKMGIEIISPMNTAVVQRLIPLAEIDERAPVRFTFAPIVDSGQGRFWLRVFVQEVEAPVRVFEWRKYGLRGLGRLQRRAFCGFIFQEDLATRGTIEN